MSESYQMYVLMPDGIESAKAVFGTHDAIVRAGGETDGSIFQLRPLKKGDPDLDPQEIHDTFAALKALAGWPTLGWMDYVLAGVTADVYYDPCPNSHLVCAIVIVVSSRQLDNAGESAKQIFLKLAHAIHAALGAKRTLMGWALEGKGFDANEEIQRLACGEFDGHYELIDLRRP